MGNHWIKTAVLRIGHRKERDKRITTHTALTARAFGATGYFLAGECDWSVMRSILWVERTWGRGFQEVSCGLSYDDYVKEWKRRGGLIVHLTMYGINLSHKIIEELRGKRKPILVVIGAEKTPPEVYKDADYNIAVGNQPHSEVAALAVFLDRLYNGEELNRLYRIPELIIKPSPKGKMVVSKGRIRDEKTITESGCKTG